MEIIAIGLHHEARIESIVSNPLVMTYGAAPGTALCGARQDLVKELHATLGDRVAILHGKRPCRVGVFGTGIALTIGSQMPQFTELVKRLVNPAPGAVEEV